MLSWFESYTKEEMPPEYIWEDSEGLEEWMERIREKRGIPASSSSGDEEPPELTDNELARVFKE